jgi:hypothetical protein
MSDGNSGVSERKGSGGVPAGWWLAVRVPLLFVIALRLIDWLWHTLSE